VVAAKTVPTGEHQGCAQPEVALGQDRGGEHPGRSSRRDDAGAAAGRVGPERRQTGRGQAGRRRRSLGGLGSWSGRGEGAHGGLFPGGGACGVGGERDLDAAAALAVRDRDGAPVQLGDPARDRQAETGATAVAGAGGEPFEHGAPVGSCDPRPLVGDGEPDVVAQPFGAEPDLPVGGAVPGRVVEEVGQQLVQAVGICGNGEVLGSHVDRVAHPAGAGLRDGVGKDVAEPDLLEPQRSRALLDAGQVEQVPDKPAQPFGLGQGGAKLVRAGVRHPVDEVLEHGLQCRDGGAQLVRHVGHQATPVPVHHLQGRCGAVEGPGQLADLVARRSVHPLGVVPLRHPLGGESHLPQGRGHAAGQDLGDGQGRPDCNGHGGPR
jgi:hypothetical protein